MKMVLDVSPLINAFEVGDVYRTGIHRVTEEFLQGFLNSGRFSIYLYDYFGRERQIRKYLRQYLDRAEVLRVDSRLYRFVGYPFFDIADLLGRKERSTQNAFIRAAARILKIAFSFLGRALKYFERQARTERFDQLKANDVYLSTYYPIPKLGALAGLRKAIIIHDLIAIFHPEYFYDSSNKELMKQIVGSISHDDTAVCVSESTRRDLLSYRSDLSPEKIHVIYLGAPECFYPRDSQEELTLLRQKYNIPLNKEFLLSVCTIEPRKNLSLILEAYEMMLEKESDAPALTLTGAYGWDSEWLLEKVRSINAQRKNSIVLTGFVKDEELAVLYSHATAFAYMSWYEGFGLPVLEAMQCGAPVITSSSSSLPEVVGDAALIVDPSDSAGLYEAFKHCMNEANAASMKANSLRRAKLFSWSKTTDTVVKLLDCH